jgi:AraC-like DNA-binding protein
MTLALARELDDIRAVLEGAHPIVGALAAWVASHLLDAGLEDAARDLALSTRTLQRRLREAGTTFHDVVTAARVDAAKRRMVTTQAPLAHIAADVGLATPQHFAQVFKRETGLSPSAWRARHKDDADGSASS